MHVEFTYLPLDLRSSPWLQRALNEDYRTVWGYWNGIHESFLAEKLDIEHRVAYVLEHNNHRELLAWAAQDSDLISGMSGPHRTVVDPDPLRVAAFRVVEVRPGGRSASCRQPRCSRRAKTTSSASKRLVSGRC